VVVVWRLLEHKADLNARDNEGQRVLQRADVNKHEMVVRLLLHMQPRHRPVSATPQSIVILRIIILFCSSSSHAIALSQPPLRP
jgi:hypothetical protein